MALDLTKKKDESHGARRWLREFFLEDWTLKLMAFVITLGLWYAVTTQRAPASMRLRAVQLDFILPENVQIGNEPVEEVDVTLEGSQSKLADLSAHSLVARANVSDLKPGDRVARLTDRNVEMDLPEGVRITDITPRSVTLHLEPVVERRVPVEVRFEGDPPDGFKRLGFQVTPEEVRVSGPESHVQAVEKAYTETISLAEQRNSLATQVAVDIPDHKVTPLDPSVSVRVEIAEERSERRFTNVPARAADGGAVTPSSATVMLSGPRSVVDALRPEDVRLVVEAGADGTTTPRLSLPPIADGRVELVSTSPSEFIVNK
ncbi:MAG TPA: CdaR family protein [Pyrinomonadaceae bacterium]|nr:CdaR family protein [Pyrinomonadaceae bacterium]